MIEQADLFEALSELALNLRGSWNHATDRLWRELDPVQWKLTRNPWGVLQSASRDRLERAYADPAFRIEVETLMQERRAAITRPAWFQKTHSASALHRVAYFSMEFMLSEALPIYSGGLGNVAGDQLKAASDLGVPVVGVGLLYAQGYFRQVIDESGAQQALYPFNDPGQLPVTPLRLANGEWLRLEISFPGYSVWLRTWQVNVGRVTLYLLDSNDMANPPAFRGITSELYGGGVEMRLQQEIILGIGGWRLLTALGIAPEVCHLNEGHAAFAILERARAHMVGGVPFETALDMTRAGNVFTTHTAVPAGFDCFPPRLMQHYLGKYAASLGVSFDAFLAFGRANPADESEPFNMAYLAIRGSGRVNGVSRLHGEVSRRLFQPLFAHWPEAEVPIGYVTNGVHTPSWDCAEADALWTTYCGQERWLGRADGLAAAVRGIPDVALWTFRAAARRSLIVYARERLAAQWAASGRSAEEVERARHLFDEATLTLGFARRFATYKRPNLLLQDPDRLIRLLSDPHRPVQLIMAGKAHPADMAGQALIVEWSRFMRRPDMGSRVVFLSDYDMLLTERLVQGVDVWINSPQRPWEACGTSGMKVLVNGGLNLSELDGWWAEAYKPNLGVGTRRWTQSRGRSALGPARCGAAVRCVGKRRGARVLRARWRRYSRRLGRPRAREHGESDPGVFGESQRARVRRAVLPAGRVCVSRTRAAGWRVGGADRPVAARHPRGLARLAVRADPHHAGCGRGSTSVRRGGGPGDARTRSAPCGVICGGHRHRAVPLPGNDAEFRARHRGGFIAVYCLRTDQPRNRRHHGPDRASPPWCQRASGGGRDLMAAVDLIGQLDRLFEEGSGDKGAPHKMLLAQANEVLTQMRNAATTDKQREMVSIAGMDLTTLFLQHRHQSGNLERERREAGVALANLRQAFVP